MPNKTIFFSYSRSDASEFALKLARDLKKAGLTIWVDQTSILPSQRWDSEIQKALTAAECVVFIASDASVVSENVQDEVNHALNAGKRVVPILLHDCILPYRTSRLQHIKFFEGYESGISGLIKALAVYRKNPKRDKAENVEFEALDQYKKGRYKEAILNFTIVLEFTKTADLYFLRGHSYFSLKRYPEAIADFTAVIELDVNNDIAYNYRGLCNYYISNYPEAIEEFSQALVIKPTNPQYFRNRAAAYSKSYKRLDAIEEYNRVIKLEPHDAEAYFLRGGLYHDEKRYREAIVDYDKALELKPFDSNVLYYRGIIKTHLDDFSGACRDLQFSCSFGHTKACELHEEICKPKKRRGPFNL